MSAHTRFDASDVPTPTTRAPRSGATVRRAKTLTRPERSVAPPPLIAPAGAVSAVNHLAADDSDNGWDVWTIFSKVVTFWAPAFLLRSIGGLHDKQVIQAWREKMALVFIIAILCGGIGFATVGLQKVLCPETKVSKFSRLGKKVGVLGIQGWEFDATKAAAVDGGNFPVLMKTPGQDITTIFTRTAASFPQCTNLRFRVGLDEPCPAGTGDTTSCRLPALNKPADIAALGLKNNTLQVGYDWDQVNALNNYLVLDGSVLNMNPYMTAHTSPIPGDAVDGALRQILKTKHGKDGTRLFTNTAELHSAVPCLVSRYYAGNIDKITPGCFVSNLVLYVGLIVIMSLILIRFVMACIFNWFISARLAGNPDNRTLNKSAISPAVLPEGANVSIDNRTGTAPWAGPGGKNKLMKGGKSPARSFVSSSTATLVDDKNGAGTSSGNSPTLTLAQIGAELFAICLVTAYSEGEDSMRTTLDAISSTTYADERKLLFVVADGMITGAGEKRSTPDICVSLLEADPRFGNPQPMGYMAVGSGSKKENRAMVYAGHYSGWLWI
jgi:chitin synthase